jgi:hypothetical protein
VLIIIKYFSKRGQSHGRLGPWFIIEISEKMWICSPQWIKNHYHIKFFKKVK